MGMVERWKVHSRTAGQLPQHSHWSIIDPLACQRQMRRIIVARLQAEPANGNEGPTTTCTWQLFSWDLCGLLIIDGQICTVQNLINLFSHGTHWSHYMVLLESDAELKQCSESRPTTTRTLGAAQCWSDAEHSYMILSLLHLIIYIVKKILNRVYFYNAAYFRIKCE